LPSGRSVAVWAALSAFILRAGDRQFKDDLVEAVLGAAVLASTVLTSVG
jgi:hypothetical protein